MKKARVNTDVGHIFVFRSGLIPLYSIWIPFLVASSTISSGQMEHCTSPMWAFLRKNMQILDCQIPPPIV